MLVAKRGYWLSLGEGGSSDSVGGAALVQVDTTVVPQSWNLVGMPLEGFPYAHVDHAGNDLVMFRYAGGYQQLDSVSVMEPGVGYWVHSLQVGGQATLRLPGAAALAKPVLGQAELAVAHAGPVLWARDGDWRLRIRLGVPWEELVEIPPRPPAAELFDFRCEIDGAGYYGVPREVGQRFAIHLQGRSPVLGLEVPEGAGDTWRVSVGGQVVDLPAEGVAVAAGTALWVEMTAVGESGEDGSEESYPNPFNASTTIPFVVHRRGVVRVVVYDMLGQQVRELVHGQREAGRHTVIWDGRDAAGQQVGAGVYLCRIVAAGARPVTRKMLLLP